MSSLIKDAGQYGKKNSIGGRIRTGTDTTSWWGESDLDASIQDLLKINLAQT
jgi:hypothetical protein